MKIAIITDSFYPDVNGLVTSILQTTKSLAEQGHSILIITAKYPENNELFIHKNVEVVRLSSLPFYTYEGMRLVLPNKKKVMRELRLFHPDVIHAHQVGMLASTALDYAKFHPVPVIASFHSLFTEQIEYVLPYRLLGLNYIYSKQNDKIKNNLTRYVTIKRFVWSRLKKQYAKMNAVITPSVSIKNVLLEYQLNKNIEVISNGINLQQIPLKKEYSEKKKFLHFGRISYERNVDIVVRAFANFLARTANKEIELHIIGNGPDLNKIKKLAEQLNLGQNIKFFGYIPREVILKDFLPNYDFVITASTMETQGMMILESFAAGLPAIGVDRYALPDLVKHNITGFIAKAFDVEELAYYIEKMYESNEAREKLGKAARAEAEKHDIKLVTKQLLEFYQKMIDKKIVKLKAAI